jgi:hypothetical protein
VTNFGKSTRGVEISVSGAGQQRLTRSVKIEPGKSYKESLDVSKLDGGGVRASIVSDGDAFSPDDVAYAYLPVKRRAKTLLVTNGNNFLESVLKLDSLVELTVKKPAEYSVSGDYGRVCVRSLRTATGAGAACTGDRRSKRFMVAEASGNGLQAGL